MSYAAIQTVASIGALAAAGWTVLQSRKARQEERDASTVSTALQQRMLETYERLILQTDAAHKEDLADREHTLVADTSMRRLAQAQEIAHILGLLADVARNEMAVDPPVVGHPLQPLPLSRNPTLLFRLDVSLSLFAALGGFSLENAAELARRGYMRHDDPTRILSAANTALQDLGFKLGNHPSLLSQQPSS